MDLGHSSKVALRWTQNPFGKLGNRLTWGSGTRGELGGVGQWINMKKVMDGWMNMGKFNNGEFREMGNG